MYNMRHPDTYQIQSKWYQAIQEVGSLCQIPLYFIAQEYPHSIQEFRDNWKNVSVVGIVI